MCNQELTGQDYLLETDSLIMYILSIGNKLEKFIPLFHEHPVTLDLRFHLYFKMCKQLNCVGFLFFCFFQLILHHQIPP